MLFFKHLKKENIFPSNQIHENFRENDFTEKIVYLFIFRIKDSKRARSRSTDHLPNMVASCERGSTAAMTMGGHSELNSTSIRKMLRPVHTAPDSPVTSPENTRGHLKVRYSIYIHKSIFILRYIICC